MSQMLVIPHRFKKIGLHNVVVRRIFSDILLVLGLKKVEKHCLRSFGYCDRLSCHLPTKILGINVLPRSLFVYRKLLYSILNLQLLQLKRSTAHCRAIHGHLHMDGIRIRAPPIRPIVTASCMKRLPSMKRWWT
jgi:hypothetical protein